jgi:hypothetical protein
MRGGELDLHLRLVLGAHEGRREVIEEGPAEMMAAVPENLAAHVVEGGQVEVHARPLEHAEDQEGQPQHRLAGPAVHDDDEAPDALLARDEHLALPRPRSEDRHPDALIDGRGNGHQGESANCSMAISGGGRGGADDAAGASASGVVVAGSAAPGLPKRSITMVKAPGPAPALSR